MSFGPAASLTLNFLMSRNYLKAKTIFGYFTSACTGSSTNKFAILEQIDWHDGVLEQL